MSRYGDSTTFLGSLENRLDKPSYEEIFPYIQYKPSLMQPEATSSWTIACYQGEESNLHLATTFQQ